jgi:hypothetical protein
MLLGMGLGPRLLDIPGFALWGVVFLFGLRSFSFPLVALLSVFPLFIYLFIYLYCLPLTI